MGPLSRGSWQRGCEEKFAAGGKSKFISRSCKGNECQFPKQNCYFSARLTVAWELEGGQAAAFNFQRCGINTFLPVGSAAGDAHWVGSTPRRNGGHFVPISSSMNESPAPQTRALPTLGHCCTDGEGGEMGLWCWPCPFPQVSKGSATHPRLWEGKKLPVVKTGIKIALPVAPGLQGQLCSLLSAPALTPTASCSKRCFLPSPSSLSYKRVDYPEIGRDGSLQPKSPAQRSDSTLSNHGPSSQL